MGKTYKDQRKWEKRKDRYDTGNLDLAANAPKKEKSRKRFYENDIDLDGLDDYSKDMADFDSL